MNVPATGDGVALRSLELLGAVSAGLARSDDLPAAIQAALRATVHGLDFEAGALFLRDRLSGDLALSPYVVGLSADYAAAIARFQPGEAVLGRVLQADAPVVVEDLAAAPEAREATRRGGFRTCVFAPLFARGHGVGVLVVGGQARREVDEATRRTLGAVGAMLGAALDGARLLESTQRHLAQVQALWEIDRAIVEDRELDEVLAAIAREAAELGGGDAAIALFEGEGGLRAAGAHGRRATDALAHWPASAGPDPATRLREGSAVSVELGNETGERLRALLLPLRSGRRPLGGLIVVKPQAALREDDLTLLATFAHQTAVALAKARARDAEDRRASQLALVSGASEIAGSTLVQDELLGALARYVQRSFGHYAVSIYVTDREARECVLAGAAGAAALMPRGHRLKFGEGIIGYVAEHGEVVVTGDIGDDPRYVASSMEGTRAELAVPVRIAGDVFAVLNVESERPNAFDEGDIVALDAIASQVAAAVRNARLFEDKLRALRNLEVVQEITNALNGDLQLDALLDRIARRSVEAVRPAQMGAVLLFDEQLRVRSSFGYPEPEALAGIRLEFHEGLPGSVFVSGHGRVETARAADYGRETAAFRRAAAGGAFRSALCVPIALPREKLGVLLLQTTTAPEPFDADALKLATTLAHQAAIAIGNALQMQRILELDRHRQGYLSNVSHELRTPLTVIQGYVEAVLEGTAGERREEFLRVALEQSQRLGRLIDEMLEISRLERGVAQRHVDFAAVDLPALVGRVVAAAQGEALARGITLERVLAPVAGLVGDERLLMLLAEHLVDNAIKFADGPGRVRVVCRAEGERAVIEVEDQGPGIASEFHERVFEKFFAIDQALNRAQGGTGIGLYLARGIAAIHAGEVRLESPLKAGRGTRVTVSLPLDPHR
ncbi:MAG: GAF domain-containing protein [Vicinamibacteria bacterium]|nr:GAF domain-containing protein [Vicinamibacteria bacterium]